MVFKGYFSLLNSFSKWKNYSVVFSTDYLESPGGRLRRFVYQEFCRQKAEGLRIEGYEIIEEVSSFKYDDVILANEACFSSFGNYQLTLNEL